MVVLLFSVPPSTIKSSFGAWSLSNKTEVSELNGTWAINCENGITDLDINKNEGFLSLYDFNAIYINIKVDKVVDKEEYVLKFDGIFSQKNYYAEMLSIDDDEISKEKPIGTLIIHKHGKAELRWVGLYNDLKKKLEFVGDDFLFIKENGGKKPIFLEKCN